MRILNIKVMRGPNYWSNYRKKLIVLELDLERYEEYPTNLIKGFGTRLESALPSLFDHHCSEGSAGGFLSRVKSGTWLGHVIEHVALELQSLGGMDCGFGRTRSGKKKGFYYIVFAYEFESAGLYAAEAAFNLVKSLAENKEYNVEKDIQTLSHLREREKFGPSTQSIIEEVKRRNIPYTRMDEHSLVMLGQGVNQKIIRATVCGTTSSIGVDLVANKEKTKKMLANEFVPVPNGFSFENVEDLDEAIQQLGFPIVIKPLDANHGRGVTTNIVSFEKAMDAFLLAKTFSRRVIVEKCIKGFDFRFLVINYKLIAVAKRTPAFIVGNDKSTIQQLIDKINNDPNRGENHKETLTKIKVDEITENILREKNLTLHTVLPIGEILFLKDAANLSSGGTATDVTDQVHPYNVLLAERIARLVKLDVCGIDVIAQDIDVPLTEKTGAVIEVNAAPGLRMHLSPVKGLPRNVAKPIVDMLFPQDKTGRIPLVAVTGTNGKTTTTRLVAHLATQQGFHVGYTTSEGVYINNHLIHPGDCTGPRSAASVLRDPSVEFAVMECARGGILRSGLGFDHCDVSIITNVAADHLGLDGIETVEEMAAVKSVVAQSTFQEGYAILNADDDLTYAMHDQLVCQIALFSMHEDNERILQHCANGGLAAVTENGFITLIHGRWKTRLTSIEETPLTMNGIMECMTQNVLASVLAAFVLEFDIEKIKSGLKSFLPSPTFTPGRMNVFKFPNLVTVLVDYAHNEHGFLELKKFTDRYSASKKTGVINATGDRREEDIRKVGYYGALMFDEVIIRFDKNTRGKTTQELRTLVQEGIAEAGTNPTVSIIGDEFEAIQYALSKAQKEELIVISPDDVLATLEFIKTTLKSHNQVTAFQLSDLKNQAEAKFDL